MKSMLLFLLVFVAVTSVVSGSLLMNHPNGELFNMSTSLLDGTPFKDFSVPGLVLVIMVGGCNTAAVILNVLRDPRRYNWALAAGIMIGGWIIVQMILIRSITWLQIVYLIAAIGIVLLAIQLKGKALF